MGLFAWFILSGSSYAAGNLLIIAATGLSFFYDKKLFKALVRIFLILGTAFIMFSPAIMPQVIIGILVLAMFSLFFALQLGAGKMGFTHIVRIILVLCACLALYSEIKYWKSPAPATASGKIFVLGGSMSASNEKSKVKAWPEILKDESKLNIVNYSVPGALASRYPERAEVIYGNDILVVIECGVDDIKMKTPLSEFKKSIEALFTKIVRPGRTIFIFEVPEYPATRGAYGKVIRESAAKFGVGMIPKRLSARIIYEHRLPDISLDQAGHVKTADLLKSFITGNSEKSTDMP